MINNERQSDEIEIDLGQIFKIILSKIVPIILTGIICALLALVCSKLLIKPTYQSTTSMYVLNRQSSGATTYSDLQTSTQLTQDYKVLIKSRSVTEKVISDLELDMTSDQLTKCITVDIPDNTRVIDITIASHDQYQAKKIADKVAEVSASSICDIMQVENVNIIEEGNLPEKASSPNLKKNAVIAFLAGFIVACAVVIIRFMLNDTIKTSEDIQKYLGLSTLALIPYTEGQNDHNDDMKSKRKHKKASKRGDK